MVFITCRKAKSMLSRLIDRACTGEEIIITHGNRIAARLVPLARTHRKRQRGSLKGTLHVGPEFFEPLPPEELTRWE